MVDLDLDKLERVLELANASYAFVHRDAANTILDATPALIAAARRTEHWVTAATEARVEVDRLRALCREAAAALDAQRMHEETCRRCVCRVERDVADSLLARLRAAGGGDTKCGLGTPGLRDPAAPCAEYAPGPGHGDCETDGHYLCRGCSRRAAGGGT